MAGLAVATKTSEAPKEYTVKEVADYLRKLQERRIFAKIEVTMRNGKITYVHRSHGMNPGDPLE